MDQPRITVYGADWCGDCRRAKATLERTGVAYEYVDLVADPSAADRAQQISGRTNIPVVVFPDGSHQVEPSEEDLQAKLAGLGLA
ncbi:mycoredoxin [Ruania zhangjianzhongii]|uniref:mycoredoxin n=1 Tax=Ruania zhangjianzhongii TaxID=2603206 RepID=UPI0011C81E13|nr:mycoredoxin [Ruania zhangjianzhongii]